MPQFKDLTIGEYFVFAQSTSFFNVCQKIGKTKYRWFRVFPNYQSNIPSETVKLDSRCSIKCEVGRATASQIKQEQKYEQMYKTYQAHLKARKKEL